MTNEDKLKKQLESFAEFIRTLPPEEIEMRLEMARLKGDCVHIDLLEKIIKDIRK